MAHCGTELMRKQKAQRIHARRRAAERYGITLDSELRNALIAEIQRGVTTIMFRQSLRVSIHRVDLDGRVYRVVYDKRRKELVTFLPLDGDWGDV